VSPTVVQSFVVAPDGRVWNGGGWNDSSGKPVSTPAAVLGDQAADQFVGSGGIAAVMLPSGHVLTFAIASDSHVWLAGEWRPDAGAVAAPAVLDTATTWEKGAPIAAVLRAPALVDVFLVGNDGRMWLAGEWDASSLQAVRGPQGFDQVAPSWMVGAGIGATLRPSGDVSTAVIGNDGVVWGSGDWTPGSDAGTTPPVREPVNNGTLYVGGPIASYNRSPATIDLWTMGGDGNPWTVTIEFGLPGNQAWTAPQALQVGKTWSLQSGIAAVNRSGVISLAVVGADGAVWNAGTYGP
jgi:hypothetical protein